MRDFNSSIIAHYGLSKSVMDFETSKLSEKTKSAIRNYLKNTENAVKADVGILFYGDTFSGKTFTLHALFRELYVKTKLELCLVSYPDLVAHYQKLLLGDNNSPYDRIVKKRVLFIDNFGKEYSTERQNELSRATLTRLFDYRNLKGLPTFIASSVSISSLEAKYGLEVLTKLIESVVSVEVTTDISLIKFFADKNKKLLK